MDRFRSGIFAAVLALAVASAFGVTYTYVRKEAAETVSGAWTFSAVPTFTNGLKTPLSLATDYTLADPAQTPVASQSATSGSFLSTRTYRLYIAWANLSGVTNLSTASNDFTPPVTLRRILLTRAETVPSGATGWLVYWSSSIDSHAVKHTCDSGGLDALLVSSGTTTYDCRGSTSGDVPHGGTNQTGVKAQTTFNTLGNDIIGFGTVGTTIGSVTQDVRRLRATGSALEYSSDSGASYLPLNPGAESITRLISICTVGCDYTTLEAACTAETSTSAAPIEYLIGPGTFVGQITACTGEDHAWFHGSGRGVTTLQFDTTQALQGVLQMGTTTNYVVSDMTIKGKIYQDLNGTNGGTIVWRDNQILTSDAFGDNDCGFLDRPGAGTRLYVEDNECRTNTDGFTCGRDCANAEFYHKGNSYGALFASSSANQTMKMVRFNSTPCVFIDSGSTISLDTAKTNGPMELYGYSWEGSEATGNCASTGRAFIDGLTSFIQNQTANQAGSAAVFVNIASGADELDELYLSANTSLIRSTDIDDTVARNVFVANTTTETYVSGGRYSTSGGTGNLDFETSGSTSNSINIMAVMYGEADEDTVNFPFRGLAVETAPATFTGSSASIQRRVSDGGLEGILLDNTDAVNTEESPYVYICNGGASEECFKVFLESGGDMRWSDVGGARKFTVKQDGSAYVSGDNLAVDHADPYLRLGDGTASDNGQVWFNSGSGAVQKWVDSTNRMDFSGVEYFRIAGITTGTVIDTAGDLTIDTTASQMVYGGASGAVKVVDPVQRTCYTQRGIASTDDNFVFWMADRAVTVTSVGCRCVGTCSTEATFTLEDNDGNAMTITGTNPTCVTTTTEATFAAVTANNSLVAGEGVAFDVTNTPVASTDWVTICITYTIDRQ